MASTEVNEKMYQYQDSLPSLPVPPLLKTLDKYLESVKPFVTKEEYKHTEEVVSEFGNGIGKQLHAKLEERAKQQRNWLEAWWEEVAYMSCREPIAVNINFGGPYPFHEDIWPSKPGSQLYRMSMLLWSYAKLWLMFRREEMPVDKARALGNKPMCMNQYYDLFNVCRIPGVASDTIIRNHKTESEGSCPCNIVIFRNGYMFTLDIVKNGEPVTPPEFYKQLTYIKSVCDSRPPGPGVGALTAWDRTSWAKARQHLIEIDPDNKKSLDVIEASIIAMVMDMDNSPSTGEEIAEMSLCGSDVYNRWFDKSSCIIVYSNGVVGCNCDHAPADAIAAIYGVNYLHKFLRNADYTWMENPLPEQNPADPEELKFNIDERIQSNIQESAEQYMKLANNVEVVYQPFHGYGKKVLKTFRIHPDTFIQQVLQLTYYKLHRKPAPTYETGTTRQFYHGRTETVRSCTVESLDWCKSVLDKKVPLSKKLELFKKAAEKHTKLMFEAVSGHGYDRHLLGLQILAKSTGITMPAIFLDQAWTKSGGNGNFVLSTSLAGYSQTIGACAPMVHNGYALTYIILDERLGFTVTAWKDNPETNAHKFFQTLTDTLNELRALTSAVTNEI
ncbi:peroxisomal carnitine O-octanoyltransferase-like [Glandiceps talaboti]